ncbi:MAG TPA: hypothetical protein PLE81_03795 [Brevundimonas sp.]|jgi:hypothetical protein|uniref:hypothetical protein n=1 Tax=Brevundimonas sp. TaxID=1871086 RepID=UPI002C672795|nr:hypothetical protein [Brevundimonas sp.]HRH19743.1 hypothetical protein [Brevundimonas sp.]
MRRLILISAAVLLGACATAVPEPETPVAWQCDAEAAQSLIGSHYAAVTFPADATTRFVCTECPMTRDYRPDRLTVFYDRDTGLIERLQCV